MVLRKEIAFFAIIIAFAAAVNIFAFSLSIISPLIFLIRLLALNGFIALSIAAIMTPFIKEITVFLRKPFTKVHHYFAAAGLVLITLHPITVAIQTLNPALLLPQVGSLDLFFLYGGSVAFIAIYVSFGAVLLRRKIASYWRSFHALMYVALFFAVVHGNLLGFDLQNLGFKIVYDALFAAVLVAFGLKRWQFHRLKAAKKKYSLQNNHSAGSETRK